MRKEKTEAHDSACLGVADAVPGRSAQQRRPSSDNARRAARISTIEGEIVPRLLMLYRSAEPAGSRDGAGSTATDRGDVEELARVLLADRPETAREFVKAVRCRGVEYDRICLGLLIPAAQHLAERWERRELSYQELAQGLSALHAVVVEIGGATECN